MQTDDTLLPGAQSWSHRGRALSALNRVEDCVRYRGVDVIPFHLQPSLLVTTVAFSFASVLAQLRKLPKRTTGGWGERLGVGGREKRERRVEAEEVTTLLLL